MFTSIAAISKTDAQKYRVQHLESYLTKLMPSTYTKNTIFPIFVIADSNDIDDFKWVMNTPSAFVQVPVLESQLAPSELVQSKMLALDGWKPASRTSEIVNELTVVFVNTMKEQPGDLIDNPGNEWFKAMDLRIESDKALPFDQCKYPTARGDVAVAVAAQADGVLEVSPDQVASDVLNEAAEQRIMQAIDSFAATVSTAPAQIAWLTTHGHSFKEIVTQMIRDGEITIDDLGAGQ